MELRQLEYFVAVAEEASFTRAAARVSVAQPGVSAQIRQLERELGQPLFDRSGRTVRLTEVGEAVLPYARAAIEAVTGARHVVDELTGLLRGHVTLGMITGCSSLELADALAAFHQQHTGVEVALIEDNSDRLLAELQTGQIDIAFVGRAGPPPSGIETQVVVDEALVAAVCANDALAASKTIDLEALRERALISLPRGTGLRAALDIACAAAGFEPRITFEASDLRVIVQLAVRGLGVAMLPESVANENAALLHTIRLAAPEPRGRLELAWRASGPTSPAAQALIRHVRAAMAK
jgi:DNA-binding transcriptional LysR family regulator